MVRLLSLLFIVSLPAMAEYKVKKIAGDLEIIWGLEFLDANTLLFTERKGTIKKLDLNTNKVITITGAPKVFSKGQGGLLDIKKHPDFTKNKRIYLTYSKNLGESKTTAIGFGILKGNKLENFKDILVGKGKSSSRHHFGSRIAFAEQNNLFFTIGERGERENAQNLNNHFGKVLYITDEGKTVAGNPFIGKKDALDEIWSYGHRNPQGLVYDSKNKILYEMEHGPRGGDEINISKKGLNYGWPLASYGKEYMWPKNVGEHKFKGTEQPIKFYDPSIAPSGLILYQGKRYKILRNSLIAGALKLTHINVYNLETKKETRLLEAKGERVRALTISPDDYIYFATDSGTIYRLEP